MEFSEIFQKKVRYKVARDHNKAGGTPLYCPEATARLLQVIRKLVQCRFIAGYTDFEDLLLGDFIVLKRPTMKRPKVYFVGSLLQVKCTMMCGKPYKSAGDYFSWKESLSNFRGATTILCLYFIQ